MNTEFIQRHSGKTVMALGGTGLSIAAVIWTLNTFAIKEKVLEVEALHHRERLELKEDFSHSKEVLWRRIGELDREMDGVRSNIVWLDRKKQNK